MSWGAANREGYPVRRCGGQTSSATGGADRVPPTLRKKREEWGSPRSGWCQRDQKLRVGQPAGVGGVPTTLRKKARRMGQPSIGLVPARSKARVGQPPLRRPAGAHLSRFLRGGNFPAERCLGSTLTRHCRAGLSYSAPSELVLGRLIPFARW